MTKYFFNLPKKEQAEIFSTLSRKIGRSALHLEKDIWLCWALQHLFSMPNSLPMAFKGGTSLSKVFRAIHRFSEDIDITIDYKAFNCGSPFASSISKSQLKILGEQIKAKVTSHLRNVILPYFQNIVNAEFKNHKIKVELANDGETVFIYYPSVLEQKSQYLENAIRLEFGGRNITIPNNSYRIIPDIANYVNDLKFPSAEATVLSPQKTFWEKITLIHYECNRTFLKEDANRVSRHWYDIIMLAQHDIGRQAIDNINQLKEVIKIKKAFYDASYARYDDCLSGKLCLIPNNNHLDLLRADFNKMIEEKMFYSDCPDFDMIINKMSKLADQINSITLKL